MKSRAIKVLKILIRRPSYPNVSYLHQVHYDTKLVDAHKPQLIHLCCYVCTHSHRDNTQNSGGDEGCIELYVSAL